MGSTKLSVLQILKLKGVVIKRLNRNPLESDFLYDVGDHIINTQDNTERIKNSIITYSKNWEYERIGKVELIALKLGISELIMALSPKKVIISEWVKITDKHSSSNGAKFVNGILDKISNEI